MEHGTHTMQHLRQPFGVSGRHVPRPAGRAATPRAAPPARAGSRPRRRPERLRGIRLTGMGCGALATLAMVGAAWLCELLGGVPTLYGVLFVAASVAAAVWVRPADLICAPIAAPLAFAAGLVTTGGLTDSVTELALRAPWLFAGTAAAALVALVRRILLMVGALLRRRARRARARF
ncbi:DUF6542 domain-containing protein [Streptomyces sp. 4N509B]|uniref:DUF6542 domain-containing protein n=1 Tax=Streptomyces sp. 4N509B TaxID=3457413 RepID=UPI003FD35FF3